MRTRRQTKQSLESPEKSPLRAKPRAKKQAKKQASPSIQKKPQKRNKKQTPPQKSVSPPSPKRRKGKNKKQQRVESKSSSKQKSNKKANDQKTNVRNAKKGKEKEKQKSKEKDKKVKSNSNDDNKKNAKSNDKRKRKQRSPSPAKNKSNQKKPSPKKQPAKDQIKKVIVKGAAPVDQYFDKGKNFHVLVYDGKIYSATLNQSNISHNNNKYYNLQVLQSDSDQNINYFFTRWGRVGTPGQKSILGPYSINIAIKQYNAKFHQKHIKGDYRQLELNYGDEEQQNKFLKKDGDQSQQVSQQNPLADFQESKLPKSVKDLINLIFDINMMNRQMKQIGYNVNKMPLGKLSKDNIKRGYNILKQLQDQIQHKNRANIIEQLTNQFYSYIPHDVGFKKMNQFQLNTLSKVKQKIQMLESLSEIKVATQLINNKQDGNKIDNNYKKLNRQISPIERDSMTYKIINDYLQSTHAKTHGGYDLQLVDLFQIKSKMQDQRYTKDIHNKMLLWHGSRLTNFVGILSQGLRIAPPQAPVTGYMFGKGVYFADMSSKSANYCFTNRQNSTGILILCEVALGNCNDKLHADYLASNLPDGKHSTKGVGRTAPKQQNFQSLDGAIIPMGPGFESRVQGASLLYNQFIVYKIQQIKIKYLLRVKFNYK